MNLPIRSTTPDEDFAIRQWEIATVEFLATDGRMWLGGENRFAAMAVMIEELGLADAVNKRAAINQAFQELKKRGLLEADDSAE
jgi:hypothetical protein